MTLRTERNIAAETEGERNRQRGDRQTDKPKRHVKEERWD